MYAVSGLDEKCWRTSHFLLLDDYVMIFDFIIEIMN